MRLSIAPKIVIRVSTVLMWGASLVYASGWDGSHGINTGGASDNQEVAVDDRPLSPRLMNLQSQLKSGDRDALANFWKEIEERGAPIIEPAAGSDGDVLVTMLWRAREETRNVFVFRLGDVSKPMARLLDTDLWYKTFRLQKGARLRLSIRDEPPRPERVARHHAVCGRTPERPAQSAPVRRALERVQPL